MDAALSDGASEAEAEGDVEGVVAACAHPARAKSITVAIRKAKICFFIFRSLMYRGIHQLTPFIVFKLLYHTLTYVSSQALFATKPAT